MSLFPLIKILIAFTISLFIAWQSFASETAKNNNGDWGNSDWVEEEISPWHFSGFTQVGYGYFLQENISLSNSPLSEITTRLNLDYSHQIFDIAVKGELIYDNVISDTYWKTRELNVSFSPTTRTDIKLGRQILTWGTGDYIFLNDLFAKNWQAFFSGRDDQYLKSPSDSVKGTWYIADYSFDFTWTDEFTPDIYLTGERFSFYSQQVQDIVAPGDIFRVQQTTKSQWAARIATNKSGVEYALYGYKGYWPTPAGSTRNTSSSMLLSHYFPQMNAWGASIRMALAGGLFNIEFSRYNSIEDNRGEDPFIANSQNRFLIGFEGEIAKDITASVQFYLEQTMHYDQLIGHSQTPETEVAKNRQLLTLRLTYSTLQQKLIYSLFNFYSPSDKDGYLKPSITYRYNDQWSFSGGANLFWGDEKHTFFGQHQQNSNAWLRIKAQF